MTGKSVDRLYNLLPEIYRIRDAEGGEILRALLAVIEEEANALEEDIGGLYNNLFIETCEEWVVPYIGDLIGTKTLHPIPSSDFSQRAYVANTLAYRRRKGTATVLEQLAHDVTGWDSRVVEYFRLLAMTQHLNHVRLDRHCLTDLHNTGALDVIGGPFESTAHSVDVRRISNGRGRHNIPNLGLFLWRLKSYPVKRCIPCAIDKHRYTFNPLGLDTPLFNNPRTEKEISHLADEINLPVMLRRKALSTDLERCSEPLSTTGPAYESPYFGSSPVISVYLDGKQDAVQRKYLQVCDLSGWEALGWIPPVSGGSVEVAVDPVLGRFYLKNEPDKVDVDYSYGFSGNIGGGPYDRRSSMIRKDPLDDSEKEWIIPKDTSLSSALSVWESWGSSDSTGIITISDSSTYDIGETTIDFSGKKGGSLWIQAADKEYPVLDGSIRIKGDGSGGTLILNGLLINGSIEIEAGAVTGLSLVHCTLPPGEKSGKFGLVAAPGTPSLAYLPGENEGETAALTIRIDHSITGAIRLPADLTTLTVEDSIIQAVSHGISVHVFVSRYDSDLSDDQVSSIVCRLEDLVRKKIRHSAFSSASVMTIENQILVIPATGTVIDEYESAAIQIHLNELKNDPTNGLQEIPDFFRSTALIGGNLDSFRRSNSKELNIQVAIQDFDSPAEEKSKMVSIPGSGQGDEQAEAPVWELLQRAIRNNEQEGSVFNTVCVGVLNGSLVVFNPVKLPCSRPSTITVRPTKNDPATAYELGLDCPYAISGPDMSPGPQSVVKRTTIFGKVYLKEVVLASEVIFNDPVTVQKTQAGCVRYCYLPEAASSTPRRYRCQPEFRLQGEAADRALKNFPELTDGEIQTIRVQLVPRYTSTLYGDPGYSQLGRTCAAEIRSGGEDGSEMGVFNCLGQPQREANLRAVFDEYLRFGLEAGFFYVT